MGGKPSALTFFEAPEQASDEEKTDEKMDVDELIPADQPVAKPPTPVKESAPIPTTVAKPPTPSEPTTDEPAPKPAPTAAENPEVDAVSENSAMETVEMTIEVEIGQSEQLAEEKTAAEEAASATEAESEAEVLIKQQEKLISDQSQQESAPKLSLERAISPVEVLAPRPLEMTVSEYNAAVLPVVHHSPTSQKIPSKFLPTPPMTKPTFEDSSSQSSSGDELASGDSSSDEVQFIREERPRAKIKKTGSQFRRSKRLLENGNGMDSPRLTANPRKKQRSEGPIRSILKGKRIRLERS